MAIKLIASDLDGTLLQNGAKEIPEELVPILRALREKGVMFAAASGRQYYSLKHLFSEVHDEISYICENGAVVIADEKILWSQEIPRNLVNQLVERIEQHPGSHALISDPTTTYIRSGNPKFEQIIKALGNQYRVVDDFDEITEPIVKVAIYEPSAAGREEESQNFWEEEMPYPARVVTSGIAWLDILFPNIDKGVGLQILRDHLGLSKEETLVFGDNLNDLEMFAEAGTSVAVTNAKKPVLDVADETTDTVVHYLERLLSEL